MNFLPSKHGFYEDEPSSSSLMAQRGWLDEPSHGSSGDGNRVVVEKEHMFDKVVTPSDVGKLNRLVIPKQHAERYFPLDSATNDKGLLLNFEDRNGKQWRFRYSYWNSSQSYVMTKGWSRFVKEKKLDAGDIVSFQRGVGETAKDRLFIDFRRRPDAPENHNTSILPPNLPIPHHFSFHRPVHPWNPLFLQPPLQQFISHGSSTGRHGYGNISTTTIPPYNYNTGSVIYFRSPTRQPSHSHSHSHQGNSNGNGNGIAGEPVVFDSVPVVQGKAAAKRLRLFGVNMDCPITDSDECEILSSTSIPHHLQNHSSSYYHQNPLSSLSSSSSIPYLQLRPYNGTPIQTLPSPSQDNYFDRKGKTSSISLNLDI